MKSLVVAAVLAIPPVSSLAQESSGPPSEAALISMGDQWGATAENFDALRDHVIPKPSELRWRTIPWRTTLTQGLRDAAAEEKPLLLWAMNGHPLGST